MPEEAVIVATARTPIGRAKKGSLADLRPDDLAAFIIRAVLDKVPQLHGEPIDDLMLGCGQPGGEQGFNMARVVAVLAGMPALSGVTVNRYCSSSLQTIRMATHAIRAGEGDCFIAAGVEMASRFVKGTADGWPDTRNPVFDAAAARNATLAADPQAQWKPADDLPDMYLGMGQTAENVATLSGVTRAEMDEFAALSQQRAVASQDSGFFAREITPVPTANGLVADDDGPRRGTTVEALSALKPVFREHGTVTAGNACPLNDGAAAVIVMSERRAHELGIEPLARVIASGVSAIDPEIMGLGPIGASRQALARAGMSIGDIDLVEINEAFAAQVIPSARELEIGWDKLNIRGGAIALGHPFGMTGARIMTTLLNSLTEADQTIGLETMCVGGGQGMAMIVERLT